MTTRHRLPACVALLLALLATSSRAADPAAKQALDFDRHVRPILAENCFACHGPDEKARKARLRLDTKDGALGRNGLIVPGKSAGSELIARITSEEPSKLMPPVKSNKKLTPQQIDVLRRWIDQGAQWTEHWAFIP